MDSESESNVTGFINYDQKNLKRLYGSMNQTLENINEDLQQVERNLKHIVSQSGCLENHLSLLLHSLPHPNIPSLCHKIEK